MDDFKRAQFRGKGSYCNCCDIHPDKCKNSQESRGRVRARLKKDLRPLLLDAYDWRAEEAAMRCSLGDCEWCDRDW